MDLLETVNSPGDLRGLDTGQLEQLAQELRDFLVRSVGATGGHLGPNLGVVELTLGIHRVFTSPEEPIIFDTGHQSYVHKILTGRRNGFDRLRTSGGLSGYPSRAESVHDVIENSHASTALAYADGMSKAFVTSGEPERTVVVVVGDGALTGGLAWEALNNLGGSGRRVVIVLNDNGRSYSPTVGSLHRHLERVVDRSHYARLHRLLGGETTSPTSPDHSDSMAGFFGALGFEYVGAVDGHDVAAVETALRDARGRAGPVVVHCLTEKGRGYVPAELDQSDHMHTVAAIDIATGMPAKRPSSTWTDAFAETLVQLGGVRPDLTAVTAAMSGPTGLEAFAERFPGRCHDVGIAEQQAVTSAAGMAMGGAHPVVALYSTFASRAFDQLLFDVGLHRLPVTLVLDRAGITGPDGASHHGIWDLSLLGIVPGFRVAAPRDAKRLADELAEAVDINGPTAIRFPKSTVGEELPAIRRIGTLDVLRDASVSEVLLVSVGAMAASVLGAADLLAQQGLDCTVVDPRWVLPVSEDLLELAAGFRLVVTVEDGLRATGVGSQLAAALRGRGIDRPVRCLGLDTAYLMHGSRADLLAQNHLDSSGVTNAVRVAAQDLHLRPLRMIVGGSPKPVNGWGN